MIKEILLLIAGVAAGSVIGGPAAAQHGDEAGRVRAEALIREAVEARGGGRYLNARTLVSRGQFTAFDKGVSTVPQSFVDYVVYPDRERTEFGKGDSRFVQSNSGATGWIYDASQKMIRDQKDEQIKAFQQGIRHDLDNVLRRGWQEPGAKLTYLGRREAWRNVFSEAVRVEFGDGMTITLHFDSRSKLPLMTEYQTVTEGKTTNDQTRFFRWVEFAGIKYPTIQDFYREGLQTARASFDLVTFDADIPEKTFVKPATLKEIK